MRTHLSLKLLCYVKLSWNISKNIMHRLEDNNILFANQHGFRKNHSCDTKLILTVEDLRVNLDHGDQMDTIILDFSKAFDKVPHQCLIRKLQFYGIQGSTLAWIKSWLTSRSQSVIVDGVCSKSVVVGTSGGATGHSSQSINVFVIH